MSVAEAVQTERLYRVPDCNLLKLREQFAKMAKRAIKMGLDAPTFEIDHTDSEPVYRMDPEMIYPPTLIGYRLFHYLRVDGQAPRIAGWQFLGKLSYVAGSNGDTQTHQVLVKSIPGVEIPAQYRDSDPGHCDHCGAYRRRSDTFVLRADDGGATKQVGRQCLGQFLGGVSPDAYASWAESMAEVDGSEWEDEGYGGGWREPAWSTATIATMSAACIRQFGWVSRAAATYEKMATADRVVRNLSRDLRDIPENLRIFPTEQDEQTAKTAVEWWKSSTPRDGNDFEHNMLVVASSEICLHKMLGFAAFLPQGYLRHLETAEDRAIQEVALQKQRSSEYQGKEGERVERELTVVFVKTIQRGAYFRGDDGAVHLTKLLDADGNVYIWWATNAPTVDTTRLMRFTVKKHEEREGVKQTAIFRCQAVPTAEQKAAIKAAKAELEKAEEAWSVAGAAYREVANPFYRLPWEERKALSEANDPTVVEMDRLHGLGEAADAARHAAMLVLHEAEQAAKL